MLNSAASLLGSDLEPGMPLVGLKPSLRQLPPLTLPKPMLLERQLVLDEKLLNRLLWYFTTAEKCVLAQVCKIWRKVLYQPKFWEGVTPILHAKELYTLLPNGEKEFVSLQAFALRGFQSFCLVGVSDLDICEFIDNYPLSKKGVRSVSLKRSTITDAGLEVSHDFSINRSQQPVILDFTVLHVSAFTRGLKAEDMSCVTQERKTRYKWICLDIRQLFVVVTEHVRQQGLLFFGFYSHNLCFYAVIFHC